MKSLRQKIAAILTFCMILNVFLPSFSVPVLATEKRVNFEIDGDGKDWEGYTSLGEGGSGLVNNPATTASALYITNDETHLYYYIDADIPNWGEPGVHMDLALYVKGQEAGSINNPLGYAYSFQMTTAPQLHIVADGSESATVYSKKYPDGIEATKAVRTDVGNTLIENHGYEGKVALKDLGLNNGDIIYPLAVITGNQKHHGAIATIPAHPENELDTDTSNSGDMTINNLHVYAKPYTIEGAIDVPDEPEIVSPEVIGDKVYFRYYSDTAQEVYVAGAFNGWSATQDAMIATNEAGVFELALDRERFSSENKYQAKNEYKFVVDTNWMGDPENENATGGGNSLLFLEADNSFEANPIGAAITGKDTVLPETGKYYNEATQKVDAVEVTYQYLNPQGGIELNENVLTVPEACEVSEIELVVTSKVNLEHTQTVKVTITDVDPSDYISPEVTEDGVIFRYYEDGKNKVFLAGQMNGWSPNTTEMQKNEQGTWEIKVPLAPGQYQYKFVVDGGWITDPKNDTPHVDGNSVVTVDGLKVDLGIKAIQTGTEVALPETGTLFVGGESITPNVTYTVVGESKATIEVKEGVSYLAVPLDETAETVTIQASAGDKPYTQDITLDVVSEMNTFTINYYRKAADYTDWNLWFWEIGSDGKRVDFTDASTFVAADGQTYEAVQVVKEVPASKAGFIVRKGEWDEKDFDGDRFIELPVGETSEEVWLVQGHETVYTDPSEISFDLRIKKAFVDAEDQVTVTFSDAPTALKTPYVLAKDGEKIAVTAEKVNDKTYRFILPAGQTFEVDALYKVGAEGVEPAEAEMRKVLDSLYYTGDDLGLTYSESASTFKVWAPTAIDVKLALYTDAGVYDETTGKVTDHKGGKEVAMTRDANGVWSTTESGTLAGQYYMYKVTFANGTTNYAVDPYARAVSANGQRTAIVDLDDTDPTGFESDQKPPMVDDSDAVIYELHVRDFSIDPNADFVNKGEFGAFTEVGLKTDGDNSIGIDHLKELGVTHVHLLPSYDYASVNEMQVKNDASDQPKFNWGYDPQNYNVPEGSYSSDPTDPEARITEFKEMVAALHDAGMRVVMDVVYNHTYSVEDGPFDKVVPNYYYRTKDDGSYANGSGCGNEVASERPMVRKYIKDSVTYWAEEYNVDGFRFDLMALIDTKTMQEITNELKNEIDPDMMVYGEPWQAGGSILPGEQQTVKGSQKGEDFKVFNDEIRGAIKGDSDGAGKGFATGEPGKEKDIITGVKGAIDTIAQEPVEVITYVTAHDNLNLWDKVITTQGKQEQEGFLKMKDGALVDGGSVEEAVAAATIHGQVDCNNIFANETVQRSLLANGIALTSQGIPFIHAGDEMLRSKYGDHNSYKSPDAINMIRWDLKDEFTPVFDYYAGLIALRNAHPAFSMETKEEVNEHFKVFADSGNVVGYTLGEYANGDSFKNIAVIYNANTKPTEVTLPHTANWQVVVDNDKAGTTTIETLSNTDKVTVAPLSMMVMHDGVRDYEQVATTIELPETFIGLEVDGYKVVKPIVKDQQGIVMNTPVIFEAKDTAVVSVQGNKLTGAKVGKTEVVAKVGKAEATLQVEVVAELLPTTVEIISADEGLVYEGLTTTLNTKVKDQFGQTMTGEIISWSSDNEAIVTVDLGGTVYGRSVGTANVTAQVGQAKASIKMTVKAYEKRYVVVEYDRPDGNYEGWNLWVWNTGATNDRIDFTADRDGKKVAFVEVGPTTERIGMIVRQSLPGNDWAAKDPDADRFVDVLPGQVITKIQLTSGQLEFDTLAPSALPVINPEEATIDFTYRNNELFKLGQMDTVEKVDVEINGKRYPMTYDAEQEWFAYTLENLQEGKYAYSYFVTVGGQEKEVLDPYNLNVENGKSVLEYKKLALEVDATVAPSAVTYNENSVVTVDLQGAVEDLEKVEKIVVDTTVIGGDEVLVAPELMAVTIAVKDDVTAGIKILPVKAYDEMNNVYKTEVALTVNTYVEDDFTFDEAVIYFMLTDRFNNGDETNDDPYGIGYDSNDPGHYQGGDFKGVTQKLDYLEELGINTIWISPIVENIAHDVRAGEPADKYINGYYGYHGYWAQNFEELNPHFGSIKDLHELIDEAHARDMKIMVDVVLNHAGYGMEGPMSNPPEHFPTDEDRSVFEGMIREEQSNDEVVGQLAGLPDFKTEDPEVRQQLVDWQTAWVETLGKTANGNSIDYFRIDTVKHVEDATWMHFKNELTKVAPDFKMIGEVWGANVDGDLGYLDSGMMDSLLDFNFKGIAEQFVKGDIQGAEQKLVDRNNKMDNTKLFGSFLSSHDEDGFLYKLGNNEDLFKAAVTLQLTAKGQPIIYYGEELGYSGKNNYPMYDNRPVIDWTQADTEDDLFKHYETLLDAREASSEVFAKGTREVIGGNNDDKYSLVERRYGDDAVVIGINLGEEQVVTIKTPYSIGQIVTDSYTGKVYTVLAEGMVEVTLPALAEGGTSLIVLDYATDDGDDDDDNNDDDDSIPSAGGGGSQSSVDKVVDLAIKEAQGQEIVTVKVDEGEQSIQLEAKHLEVLAEAGKPVTVQLDKGDIQMPQSLFMNEAIGKIKNIKVSYEEVVYNKEDLAITEAYQSVSGVMAIDLSIEALDGKVYGLGDLGTELTITVKLNQDLIPENADIRKMGVYYIDNEGTLTYMGGEVTEAGITFTTPHLSMYTAMIYEKTFADIQGHWAQDVTEVLASRHVLKGMDDDTYNPEGTLTKAEFAVALATYLKLQEPEEMTSNLIDTTKVTWYTNAIVALEQAGIIMTSTEQAFNPAQAITREEVAGWLGNCYAQNLLSVGSEEVEKPVFEDAASINPLYTEAIQLVQQQGIISGYPDGTFKPQGELTRAEMAQILYSIMME